MPKALWLQDDRDCHKFTIWNNKTRDWIVCKEYLGIGDRFALNLFRLGKRCSDRLGCARPEEALASRVRAHPVVTSQSDGEDPKGITNH